MKKFTYKDVPDFNAYIGHLRYCPYIFMEKEGLANFLEYEDIRTCSVSNLAVRTISANTGGRYASLDPSTVRGYLTRYENVPADKFKSYKNKSGVSLSKDICLDLLRIGYAKEFLSLYTELNSMELTNSKLQNLLRTGQKTDLVNHEGKELIKVPFNVNLKKNYRCNYNNSDIIAIPNRYDKFNWAPRGWVIVDGDFEQSDFRGFYNTAIKTPENLKIMNQYKDKYKGMAVIVENHFGNKFEENKFVHERKLYKTNIIGASYGKATDKDREVQAFLTKINKYLRAQKKYSEFLERINARYDAGLDIEVTGYFGTKESTAYVEGKKDRVSNQALNSPYQLCTSELMCHLVNSIMNDFASLGLKEGEDVRVYFCRHDQPIFMIREELLEYAWVFKNHENIQVDDWTMLNISFSYGRFYGDSDSEITKLVNEVYHLNEDKIEYYEPTPTELVPEYYPYAESLRVGLSTWEVPGDGSTLACIYNDKDGTAQIYRVPKDFMEYSCRRPVDIAESVMAMYESKLYGEYGVENDDGPNNISGFETILYHNKLTEESWFGEGIYIKGLINYDKLYNNSRTILGYVMSKYCEKHEFNFNITFSKEEADLISSTQIKYS